MERLKEYIRNLIREELNEATMNAEEMARHKKKLEKLKKILAKQGDQMMPYPADLPNTVFNAKLMNEDLRDWFGTGGKGGVGGGGWDRYNSSGDRIGKCGDAKEGESYSACLSKEKAEKLGKAGRAAFVKRKRAAQKKGGDAKKGGEHKKGQKPIKVKTGASNESILNEIELFLEKNIPTDKSKWSYYKSQAKKKFDVYPSAYANAWAAKMYKKAGGGWRKSK